MDDFLFLEREGDHVDGWRRGGGGRRMLSEQTPFDPLSLIIEVDLDSYGRELNNEAEYKFRLVALNTSTIVIHPK